MLQGLYTALVTPFKNDQVDEDALRKLIDHQLESGVDGIVPVGTTGESPTLDYNEHHRVIELAVEQTNGRGIVMAGTGSNSTREAVELTQAAEKSGASHALVVAPYYNKPPQEGLYQHFRSIAESTSLKIVLYSIPGRCGVEIGTETVLRLAQDCPNIIAIKEAGGQTERVHSMRSILPDDFAILSGDDSLTLPFMAAGGNGVISVASNLIPAEMAQLVREMLAGDIVAARATHYRFYPLFRAFLKIATNPIPIKEAMHLAGKIPTAELRLPMIPLNPEAREKLRKALVETGVL